MPDNALRGARSLFNGARNQGSGPHGTPASSSAPRSIGGTLLPGDTIGLVDIDSSGRFLGALTVSGSPCWILKVDKANKGGVAWLIKARTVFSNQREREREMLRSL